MNIIRKITLVVSFLLVSACAHKTPFTEGTLSESPQNFCDFKRYALNLNHRNDVSQPDFNLKSLNELLTENYSEDATAPMPKDDMLFLSGGSLNGAFGAGVLQGWAEKEGELPAFSVVTGVSTGAILSLAAFTNKPMAAVEGYSLERESQAIDAFVRRDKNGRIKKSAYLTAVRKGALADISPLKDSTYDIVARHEIFPEIARRAAEHRRLFTGVVDVDTGEAVALDMTDMAKKIMDAVSEVQNPGFKFRGNETVADLKKRAPAVGHYVDCFTSAIAASSSVPLAARPIAIDNRLYIDGGARFLVFGHVIGPIIDPSSNFTKDDDEPIEIYVIINSDQQITPKCGKKECPEDLSEYNYWNLEGAREDWNVLGLVERTVDVLKTQVGEFSEAEIRFQALEVYLASNGINIYDLFLPNDGSGILDAKGFNDQKKAQISSAFENNLTNYNINTLKIEPETLERKFNGKTCIQWRKHDEKTDRNLQFHLNYMKCTISAGKAVIKEEGWK